MTHDYTPESWPECKEFYELMQHYRHINQHHYIREELTVDAYERVKEWLRNNPRPIYSTDF